MDNLAASNSHLPILPYPLPLQMGDPYIIKLRPILITAIYGTMRGRDPHQDFFFFFFFFSEGVETYARGLLGGG